MPQHSLVHPAITLIAPQPLVADNDLTLVERLIKGCLTSAMVVTSLLTNKYFVGAAGFGLIRQERCPDTNIIPSMI